MSDLEKDVIFAVKIIRGGKVSEKDQIWQRIEALHSYMGPDRHRFGREVRDAVPEDSELTGFVFDKFEKNGI